MERIELADFLLICEADAVTGIPAEELIRGYCRIDQALAALAVPFSGFADVQVYPAPHEKVAGYCSATVRYHPLVDGNKRAGYLTMRMFIARNGYNWTHGRDGQAEAVRAVEALAAGTLSEDHFTNWVGHRMHDES